MTRWTLRTATTAYTVEVPEHGSWAELSSWGPIGVEDGPSPLAGHGRTPFRTAADAAPAEYLPFGQRPFGGAELDLRRPGGERGSWWSFAGERPTGKGSCGWSSPIHSSASKPCSATASCPART